MVRYGRRGFLLPRADKLPLILEGWRERRESNHPPRKGITLTSVITRLDVSRKENRRAASLRSLLTSTPLKPISMAYRVPMPEKFWGPWTVYRRKEDAWTWRRFHDACALRRIRLAEGLAEAVKDWITKQPK